MTAEATNTILLFRTSGRLVAVPIAGVQEVVPAFEILRTPGLATTLAGMISLRGEVLPVIDTSVLFGGDAMQLCPQQKFIIIRAARQLMALLVDTVEDLEEIGSGAPVRHMDGRGELPFDGIVPVNGEMAFILDIDGCCASGRTSIPDELCMDAVKQEGPLS